MSTSWPDGYGRRILASVDSTNAEAARIANTLSGPEWILALNQTAARGRRGRAWVNPEGNFAATLVLICAGEAPQSQALRSFVASLALYDALVAAGTNPASLSLKWPNDVLLNGQKLAGILLESLPQDRLAIGIGVNLAVAPGAAQVEEDALPPISLVAGTGREVTPEELLGHLAVTFAGHEQTFSTHGFAPIRAAWIGRAGRLGEPLRARTGKEEFRGTFTDVDGSGNLILKTSRGMISLPAADIYF